jgi:PIN domain nuclease of toxin-antitoxin system
VKLLLDTHIWLWLIAGDARLKPKLRSILQDPDNELWLSPISVWEALLLAEKGKIVIDNEPRLWVQQALSAAPTTEATLSYQVAVLSRTVQLPHADPADRFLVATALTYRLKLVTVDTHIRQAKVCELVAG